VSRPLLTDSTVGEILNRICADVSSCLLSRVVDRAIVRISELADVPVMLSSHDLAFSVSLLSAQTTQIPSTNNTAPQTRSFVSSSDITIYVSPHSQMVIIGRSPSHLFHFSLVE
jgi:hypothetical protein